MFLQLLVPGPVDAVDLSREGMRVGRLRGPLSGNGRDSGRGDPCRATGASSLRPPKACLGERGLSKMHLTQAHTGISEISGHALPGSCHGASHTPASGAIPSSSYGCSSWTPIFLPAISQTMPLAGIQTRIFLLSRGKLREPGRGCDPCGHPHCSFECFGKGKRR